ncbi:unnamed protein product, partial [Ectocarpus sp. 12 AP-2014]
RHSAQHTNVLQRHGGSAGSQHRHGWGRGSTSSSSKSSSSCAKKYFSRLQRRISDSTSIFEEGVWSYVKSLSLSATKLWTFRNSHETRSTRPEGVGSPFKTNRVCISDDEALPMFSVHRMATWIKRYDQPCEHETKAQFDP